MTSPSASRRWLPAVAAVFVLAAGCAGGPDAAPTTAGASSQPTGASTAAASPPGSSVGPAEEVVSVRLTVSGGIAGAHETYSVSRDDPPTGMSPGQVERVLALAADPSVRGYEVDRMRGAAPCCDVRVFEVTVRYADGSRTRIRTAETLDVPPEVERLVTLLSAPR